MKILYFIENHKEGILGSLLLHFIFLVGFNYVQVQTYVSKDPVIVMDFFEPILPKEVQENDPLDPTSKQESVESNTAINEARPKMLSSADYNKINDEVSESAKEKADDKILQELRALEQQVIDEQRAAGYGYTDEEAEKLVNSFKADELVQVPEQDVRSEGAYTGTTNISYRLSNRYDVYIYVPIYLCQQGGEVTVNLVVNKNGTVVKAKIDASLTRTTDACLLDAAVKAAYKTKFNKSEEAPSLQRGSITFVFSPQ